jgi:transcriptional regulator with XRE-family HTH domain
MTHSDDPQMQRRRLRVELRQLRKEAGLRQQDVASSMDWSSSKLIRIENGSVRVAPSDVRLLLAHYGVTDPGRIEELVGMARRARTDPWGDMRGVYSSEWITYFGLESSATSIRHYEPIYVPGLLQTEEYARAIFRVEGHSHDAADRMWEGRHRRQDLHDRQQPPEMSFVLDEAVVRRHVGGQSVMRRQWERLRTLSRLPHITLQVLPFAAGEYDSIGRSFILLEFADPNDDDIVYIEQAATVRPDSVEATATFADAFWDQQSKALTPDDTMRLLERLIADTDAVGGSLQEEQPRPPPDQEAARMEN